MPITIDNPTAEAIFEALKNVPTQELARLKELLPSVDQSTEWSDEDLQDFSNAGAALYEESDFYASSRQAGVRFFEDEEEEL